MKLYVFLFIIISFFCFFCNEMVISSDSVIPHHAAKACWGFHCFRRL